MALTKVKASNITLTTAAAGSNDTTPATTQYVTTAINNLIDGAPATLNTLDEIAAALNDDAALNTTLTNAIAAKLPLAGGTLTGALTMSVSPTVNNARLLVQRASDDSSIAFADNASGTPSSHTWAIGYDYSAGNGLAIAYANNGIPSLSGSQKILVLPSGFVGIGTTGPFAKSHIKDTGYDATLSPYAPYGAVQLIEGAAVTDNNWGHLVITDTATGNGNGGSIRFATGASNALNPFAGIQGDAEGTSYGGLRFYTRASGGEATERMRIRSDGTTTIGQELTPTYDNDQGYPLHIQASTGQQTYLAISVPGAASGDTGLVMGHDGTGTRITNREADPMIFGISSSEKMRIAGATGNVGIGTGGDPSTWAKLEVAGTAGAQTGANQALYVRASTATANEGVGIRMSAASGSHEAVGIIGMVNNASGNAGSMTFHTYNLGATIPEVMRLDNKGNLGLGVVPTANWWANATALQISPTASLWNTSNYEDFNIGNNVYTDGTDKYLQNDAACKIRLTDSGLMDFRVASAGTAGNAISFITALAIDSTGVLIIDSSQGKAAGKHDMEIGNASKSHNVFLRPYMFFGTRYSAWDTNLGWNAETDAMTTNSGIVQGTGYGASGASNLIVGADTLSWYRWGSAQCTGSGASLAVNSTYLYMQASTAGFNIKGTYSSNASDRRLKDNITPITNALDKVKQLTGNTFTWKTTIPASGEPIPEHKAGKADMGVIAQEVQEVVPTAVQLSPWDSYIKEVDNPNFNGDLETGGPQTISDPDGFTSVTGENYLTVNEEKLVPLLIEAIKELEARVAELEG